MALCLTQSFSGLLSFVTQVCPMLRDQLPQIEELMLQLQTELALLRVGTQTQVQCGKTNVLEAVAG